MSSASCAEPKKVAGTFQQQLDLCIKHLQDLRASGPGAASISAETHHALLEVMNPRRQSSDGTIEQVQAACASASRPLDSTSAESTPTIPRGSYASVVKSVRGFSPPPPPSSGAVELGKFGSSSALREYPSGEMKDFQLGLLDRIGMPHLEFYKAMESEHCTGTGCDSIFTTRNYGITTFPKHEWDVVMGLATPPLEHMLHNRKVPNIDDKWCGDHSKTAKKANLRREEVISVVLYTGPMYVVYNAILTRFRGSLFDNGQSIWGTLNGDTGKAKNLYPTTLNVLVSAVQKLSTVTVYRDDMLLYRGTGGEVDLPDHFYGSHRDALGCCGMTDWGFFSATNDLSVARNYSGLEKGKPNPVVFEIQTNCVDRGASIEEFSQYAAEGEHIFAPCSFVEQVARAL